jgi:hypothetical protein
MALLVGDWPNNLLGHFLPATIVVVCEPIFHCCICFPSISNQGYETKEPGDAYASRSVRKIMRKNCEAKHK